MGMERYHGLDAVRAGAMLLGVVLHAMMIYTETWVFSAVLPDATVTPPETPQTIAALVLWIHLWRMPLFMVLAGFFAQMVLDRRGPRGFLSDRALRVGGVLLLFVPVLNALSGGPWGTLDHLWFLWWLLWFCALAAGMKALRLPIPALRLDRRWVWAVILVAFVPLSYLGRIAGLEARIPRTIMDLDVASFVYHFALFALGQCLWVGRASLTSLARARNWGTALGLGTLSFLVMAGLLVWIEATHQDFKTWGWTLAPLSAGMMLGYTFGFVGLAQALVTKGSRTTRALSRLAYPVYIFHLYPVLGATAVLHNAGYAPGATVILGTAYALAISTVLALMLRLTPLDWLFTGPAKAWWRWPLPPRDKPRDGTQRRGPETGPRDGAQRRGSKTGPRDGAQRRGSKTGLKDRPEK